MSDCRLTTFDNPYDPFEQFTLWWLFDNEKGYNTCGKLDRISHFTDDMSDKEIDEEHERAVAQKVSADLPVSYKFFTNNVRTAFNTARIITPTSAKMATHMFAIPKAPRIRQRILMPIAK